MLGWEIIVLRHKGGRDMQAVSAMFGSGPFERYYLIKRIWCFIWGHDWKGISVKEQRLRGGYHSVTSLMECFRCRAWKENSKRFGPPEN